MIETTFDYQAGSDHLKIIACATDVDSFDAENLQLFFYDESGSEVFIEFDRDTFIEIEELAIEHLSMETSGKELYFD